MPRRDRGRGGVFGDELGDRGRERGADTAPVGDAFVLEVDGGRLGAGIVGADDFNGAAVAGAVFLDDDDAVVGLLAGAEARQTNHYHGVAVPFKLQICWGLLGGRPHGRTAKRKGQTDCTSARARLNT